MDTESVRESFKPSIVRLLLVAESPPYNGGFFYFKERSVNMRTYTARAFEKAHGTAFQNAFEFLKYFQNCGCYLDDLCQVPIDNLPEEIREVHRQDSIDKLALRIREMNPPAVAIALRRIETHVRVAIQKSNCTPEVFHLPFAGNGHQNKYVQQLTGIIEAHVPINNL